MKDASARHLYLIALGSNRALSARLGPAAIIAAAACWIGQEVGRVIATAPVIHTRPVGPSRRRFANSALLLDSAIGPDALLARLQAIERRFGRRRGRRWGERPIDIDIILWSGGCRRTRRLTIPHPAYRQRDFVLIPALALAPGWRDPVTGHDLRHVAARLHKPRTQG